MFAARDSDRAKALGATLAANMGSECRTAGAQHEAAGPLVSVLVFAPSSCYSQAADCVWA
jgi:hypothetical protein